MTCWTLLSLNSWKKLLNSVCPNLGTALQLCDCGLEMLEEEIQVFSMLSPRLLHEDMAEDMLVISLPTQECPVVSACNEQEDLRIFPVISVHNWG